jgi:hypothetical protein
MSKRKSSGAAAESPSPPERVCIFVVDTIFGEFEVEICCQRTDGVDRVFSTSMDMDWLRAERPSESTLAYSVETLLFSIIARCLRYVGEPVDDLHDWPPEELNDSSWRPDASKVDLARRPLQDWLSDAATN